MTARVRIKRRNAHQPVHAGFGLGPAVGVMPLDEQHARFEASLVAGRLLDDLDLESMALRPARIHAKQHARPVAALGPARAGMNLYIGIVAVDLAGQQRLDLEPLGLELEALQLVDPLFLGGGIIFRLGEFDEGRGVVEFAFETRDGAETVFEFGALAHDFLRGFGVVPEIWIFDLGVQLFETAISSLDVKDASSAIPWIA